jgi:hypothetical protein
MLLKGNRFQDMDEIKCSTMTRLLAFPKMSVPKVLQTVKGLLELVCGVGRDLL